MGSKRVARQLAARCMATGTRLHVDDMHYKGQRAAKQRVAGCKRGAWQLATGCKATSSGMQSLGQQDAQQNPLR